MKGKGIDCLLTRVMKPCTNLNSIQRLPCIRLARGKFELTNQHSAGGKNFSVLTLS